MKLCQHKLTLAYFVSHQVYFFTQRSTRQRNNNLGLLPRARSRPHTPTHTHIHPHTPTHTHTHTHHPLTPIPPSPTPASQPPTSHPLILHLPIPPHHSSLLAGCENTKSMDVLLIQRVRGISRGIGRKPTAGTEISRSAAPKAGRVTTTRALGFGCHSVSQRSLHVQPKGRITYEDGGNPNTGTHEMKTHTHTQRPATASSPYLI